MRSLGYRSASIASAIVIVAAGLFVSVTARAEVNELRVGFGYGLVYLPIMVADAQGYFAAQAKKAGLGDFRVAIRRFSGPPALNDALISGNIDAAAIGTPGFTILWDKTRGRGDMRGLAALAAHLFVVFSNNPKVKSFTDFSDQDRIA